MNTKKNSGEAATVVLLVIVILGGAFAMFRPKFTHGDSRRAEQSQEATAEVQRTTEATDQAAAQRSATAAASVVQIAAANATAPDSPEKTYIAREAPVALANLEAPDPVALRAAYERRIAVMEGRIAEANRLYDSAFARADSLAAELIKAQRERDMAMTARVEVDRRLAEVAAARLAADKMLWRIVIIGGLLALLAAWIKFSHISPSAMREAVADIRAGTNPITALDGVMSRSQQAIVRTLTKLKT